MLVTLRGHLRLGQLDLLAHEQRSPARRPRPPRWRCSRAVRCYRARRLRIIASDEAADERGTRSRPRDGPARWPAARVEPSSDGRVGRGAGGVATGGRGSGPRPQRARRLRRRSGAQRARPQRRSASAGRLRWLGRRRRLGRHRTRGCAGCLGLQPERSGRRAVGRPSARPPAASSGSAGTARGRRRLGVGGGVLRPGSRAARSLGRVFVEDALPDQGRPSGSRRSSPARRFRREGRTRAIA